MFEQSKLAEFELTSFHCTNCRSKRLGHFHKGAHISNIAQTAADHSSSCLNHGSLYITMHGNPGCTFTLVLVMCNNSTDI